MPVFYYPGVEPESKLEKTIKSLHEKQEEEMKNLNYSILLHDDLADPVCTY